MKKMVKVVALVAAVLASAGLIARKWASRGPESMPSAGSAGMDPAPDSE